MSRLHVTGASGAGTTTLARAVAAAFAVPHADADDYYWEPTDPPYTRKREPADRVALMERVFVPRPAWVLSGSMLGWGDAVVAQCDGVVFLALDPAVRLRRLVERERLRGSDDPDFLTWARGYDDPAFEGRNRARHEAWLAGLSVPVLALDSARPVEVLRDEVLAWAADQIS